MKAGWTRKPIGDVFKVVNGGTPKTGVASNWDGPHAWITPAEMGNLDTPFIAESRRTLTDEGLRTGAELVPAGSIILSSRAPIGHLVINEIPMAFNQGCKGLIPSPAVDTKFAYYFLLTNVPLLESLGTGATFKELSGGKLKEVQFQFPALGEQRRIVTLLDEAFADIATAKTNAEKNLQHARELFESHLQAAFKLQEDWTLKSFGDLAEFRNGINFTKSSKGEAIKIVGVRDFQKNFWAPLDDLETIIPEGEMPASDLIQSGDILFVRSNGNPELIGRSLLVGDLQEPITHSGFTIKARLRDAQLSPIYLCHYLKSGLLRREMIEGGNGANIKSLNQGTLSRLKIAFPDKAKQLIVVEQLEKVQAGIAELESIYRQKLIALDDLKKSLLHQAFSGQL